MTDTTKKGSSTPSQNGKVDKVKELEDMERKLKSKKGAIHGKKGTKSFSKQDPEWTNQFPLLKELAGTVALNFIAGMALDTDLKFNNYSLKTLYPTKVIGIPFIPHVGNEDTSSDPYNTVSRATWLELHRLYRGMGAYQQADLGVILLCVEDVFEAISEAERAYGCCYKYNLLNRNIPTNLFKAMHIDLTSIQKDMPTFRMRLNTLIQKARVLCLPKGIMYVQRHIEMVSRIFKDAESNRASLILFRRVGSWFYAPTTFTSGSAAKFISNTSNLRTADDLLDRINEQLESLLNDDDVTRVCSDILAAYAKNDPMSQEVMTLTYLMEDYSVEPEYNSSWLLEIHNLCTSGIPAFDLDYTLEEVEGQFYATKYPSNIVGSVDLNTLYVYQVDNVIKANAYITRGSQAPVGLYDAEGMSIVGCVPATLEQDLFEYGFVHPGNYIYDTWKESLEKDDIFDINAFKQHNELDKVTATGGSTKYFSGHVVNFTTELIPFIEMFGSLGDGQGTNIPTFVFTGEYTYSYSHTATAGYTGDFSTFIADLSKVDWHPLIIENTYGAGDFRFGTVYGDLDNPVIKGRDVYGPISTVSRLSLLVNPLCKHLLVVK